MAHNEVALKKSDVFLISKNSKLSYRYLVLKNGLKVALISNPSTDMASASMSVCVGSFHDPDSLPGLAHFLEHMLFLGSEKYPGENEYSEYLSENGGHSNAYTAAEETNYHFEVAPAALDKALDMFSGFFTSPLFTPDGTDRELKAVDAEHAKNLTNDSWRLYQLDKSTSKPGHPYNKFGTGDSRTLRDIPAEKGIDVRANLLAFHKEHYSASRMSLVVLGAESLDVLQRMVEPKFSSIADSGSRMPVVPGHPHDTRNALLHRVVPVKDVRQLSISWALPEQRTLFRSKPSQYLSHLIGHEGPGSILAYLKSRGWATSLSAGLSHSNAGSADFGVQINLSPEGLQQWQNVISVVYAYIGIIVAAGPQAWIFDEAAKQAAASYRFASERRAMSTTIYVAQNLGIFPPEYAECGPELYWDFDASAIAQALALFTPENSRVVLAAKSFADVCDLSEKWYGTKYSETPFDAALIGQWRAAMSGYAAVAESRGPLLTADKLVVTPSNESGVDAAEVGDNWIATLSPPLALPAENEFIATDFKLRHPELRRKQGAAEAAGLVFIGDEGGDDEGDGADEGEVAAADGDVDFDKIKPKREPTPQLIRDDARSMVWWHMDDHFAVPKVYLRAEIQLPAAYSSPRNFVLCDILVRLLHQSLTDFAYAAELAELQYNITACVQGLHVVVGGFSHKAPLLLRRIAERIATFRFDEMSFNIQLDNARRSYANFNMEAPIQHAMYAASVATFTPKWHNDDKITAARDITLADMHAYYAALFKDSYFIVMIDGNADKEEALFFADQLIQPLTAHGVAPMSQSQLIAPRISKLPLPLVIQRPVGLLRRSKDIPVSFDWAYEQPIRNAEDPNAGMVYAVQLGPIGFAETVRNTALAALVAHMLAEPYFDSLRTKQTLGYIVRASLHVEGGIQYIYFLAQSNKVDAPELVRRTDNFLVRFAAKLRGFTEAKLRSNIAAVLTSINRSVKSLNEESQVLFNSIQQGWFDFHRAALISSVLKTVTLKEVQQWFTDHVAPWGVSRRALIATVKFSETAQRGEEVIPADVLLDEEFAQAVVAQEEQERPGHVPTPTHATGPTGSSEPVQVDAVTHADGGVELPSTPSKLPTIANISLSAAQGARIVAGLDVDGVRGNSEKLFKLFESVGADLSGFVDGHAAGGTPPDAIRCSIRISSHEQVRSLLPHFANFTTANLAHARDGLKASSS